jgi:N-acetylneuraminate epimerase
VNNRMWMLEHNGVCLVACACAVGLCGGAEVLAAGLSWSKLPPLPNQAGLGGPYAGVTEGKLLVAGGANFPQAPPWEGGKKSWYDTVYVLSDPAGPWQDVGKLPNAAAYGVSATAPDGVVCAGGSDFERHYREVYLLRLGAGGLERKPLPLLPRPMANGCGAMLGNLFYVAGGLEEPAATNALHTFWALDLAAESPAWRELDPWPGPPRMLSVAAAQDGAFYLFSGTGLSGDAEGKPVRHYLSDVYRYRPGSGWKRMADMPRPALAAPSPAPALEGARILILSGDDGTQVTKKPSLQHPGFARDVLAYNTAADSWTRVGEVPATQVTVPAVLWRGEHVVPNGEIQPGIRTPDVWSVRPGHQPARGTKEPTP